MNAGEPILKEEQFGHQMNNTNCFNFVKHFSGFTGLLDVYHFIHRSLEMGQAGINSLLKRKKLKLRKIQLENDR